MPTFPLTVEVPPTAFFTSAPGFDPFDLGGGVDETPVDWPTRKIAAIEVEATAVVTPDSDGQLLLAITRPDTSGPVPSSNPNLASGIWTGPGTLGVGIQPSVQAFRFNKFGGWRTDYLSVDDGVPSTANRTTGGNSGLPAPLLDPDPAVRQAFQSTTTLQISMLCRRSNWASSTALATVFKIGNVGLYLPNGGTTYRAQITMERSDLWPTISESTRTMNGPLSDLDLVNGQWHLLTLTYDPTNGVRIYNDGALKAAWPLSAAPFNINDRPQAGSLGGFVALGNSGGSPGVGFDGDYSSFSHSINGVVRQTLTVDAMDSVTDTSWTPLVGVDMARGSAVSVTGADIPATERAFFTFDEPQSPADFALYVSRNAAFPAIGEFTIDEIVLELFGRGPRLGLYR